MSDHLDNSLALLLQAQMQQGAAAPGTSYTPMFGGAGPVGPQALMRTPGGQAGGMSPGVMFAGAGQPAGLLGPMAGPQLDPRGLQDPAWLGGIYADHEMGGDRGGRDSQAGLGPGDRGPTD